MGTAFDILVLLHVLCVIGGFGAVAYSGLYTSLASRQPDGGTSAVLEVNRLISGLAEMLIYAALLFGIGAVAASHSTIKFSSPWVSAAFGVYLVDIALLHAWIRPSQRMYAGAVRRLEAPTGSYPSMCGDCGECGKCDSPSAGEDTSKPGEGRSASSGAQPAQSGVVVAEGQSNAPTPSPSPTPTPKPTPKPSPSPSPSPSPALSPLQARAKDVEDLRRYERRINVGWACFNLLVVGAVYLMVFKPGGR